MDLKRRSTQKALVKAVRAGMKIVREFQGGHLPDDPEIKDDKTLVTVTDHRSEEEILSVLKTHFPDIPVWGEEGGKSGEGEDLVFLVDPLDGTRAFSGGLSTSTVIVGVHSFDQERVVGCVVGEAATGRIWSAFVGGSMTFLGQDRRNITPVWRGPLDEQATVFLDVSHGFTRKNRQILTDHQLAQLFARLNGMVKLAIPGSNGLQQALVANGGQKVVGSITTAIGGPWDVCGARLVLNAGGAARAFSVVRGGRSCGLTERNPLNVMSYDILICGNTAETVNDLSRILMECAR